MADSSIPSWELIAQRKREALLALLPAHFRIQTVPSPEEQRDVTEYPRKFLSEKEIEITEKTAGGLLAELARGSLSAVEVVNAFAHRATIAHQLVNCLSEVLFAEALERATELDEYLCIHGKPIGPLHGLPISLKDQFRVKGAETSLGYVAWLGKVETVETESWLVKALKEQGAIIFAKTNVPPSLMAIETNNNIIGYTTNPHNRLLSSGGSSGGEAALIAMRGSVLGLGSDFGASVRLPAAFNGVLGLKPSHGRVPYLNVANSMEGHETVNSTIGPLGHTISDLQLIVKSIIQSKPWRVDPKVINLPWRFEEEEEIRQKISSKRLTFGVLRTDGIVQPHPPVSRAIDETVAALRRQGYEVIEWTPPSHAEGFGILWNTFVTDGGTEIFKTLSQSGEPPVPELASAYGETLCRYPVLTVNEHWTNNHNRSKFQAKYLSYWNSTAALTASGESDDAIIAPVAPTASYRPRTGIYPGYTGVFNVLDYSAAVVPVTKVDATKDKKVEGYTPVGDMDTTIWNQYEPEAFHGAPVGVQVICRRLEEEKVLLIAEDVQRALRNE